MCLFLRLGCDGGHLQRMQEMVLPVPALSAAHKGLCIPSVIINQGPGNLVLRIGTSLSCSIVRGVLGAAEMFQSHPKGYSF